MDDWTVNQDSRNKHLRIRRSEKDRCNLDSGIFVYKLKRREGISSCIKSPALIPGHHPWSGHHITWRKYSEYLWADWARTEIYVDTDWGEGSDHQPSHVRLGLVSGHPWSGCSSWDESWPGGTAWASQIDISRQTQTRGTSRQPGLAFSWWPAQCLHQTLDGKMSTVKDCGLGWKGTGGHHPLITTLVWTWTSSLLLAQRLSYIHVG